MRKIVASCMEVTAHQRDILVKRVRNGRRQLLVRGGHRLRGASDKKLYVVAKSRTHTPMLVLDDVPRCANSECG